MDLFVISVFSIGIISVVDAYNIVFFVLLERLLEMMIIGCTGGGILIWCLFIKLQVLLLEKFKVGVSSVLLLTCSIG